MNERFLSWLDLVPSDASICAWGVPAALLDLLGARIDETGEIWLGWHATPTDLPALSDFRALVLIKPRGISISWLRTQGFIEIRSFAIVPNISDPRWFIPLAPKQAALHAWDLYTPFRTQARLVKIAAKLLTRGLGTTHVGDQIILARRQVSALEEVLSRAVRAQNISIAIAAGTPGPRRKQTLQLTTPGGVLLGYAKYAGCSQAGALIRHEAEFLDSIRKLGLRRVLVPTTLYHGAYNNGHLMISAPLADRMSETRLTHQHADALDELARHTTARPAKDLLRVLRDRANLLSSTIEAAWRERFSRALAAVAAIPGLSVLPTALSHGDFAPWNIRVDRRSNQLAIFDWEDGRTDRFLLWDIFHFQTQVAILVHRRAASMSVPAALSQALCSPTAQRLQLSAAQVGALFVAYLTDVSLRQFEERAIPADGAAARDAAQDLRGQMLDVAVAMLATLPTEMNLAARPPRPSRAS